MTARHISSRGDPAVIAFPKNPRNPPRPSEPAEVPLGRLIARPRRAGLLMILAFCGAFMAWSALAPLAGGAVAPGEVVPDSGIKTVRHLEGGRVRQLLVREGERVERDAPLLMLDEIGPQAEVAALADRRRTRLAETARLEAELLQLDAPAFPAEIEPTGPVARAEIETFRTRRAMLETRRTVLHRRIDQLEAQIVGLEAQREAATEQLALVETERGGKEILLERGLLRQPDLLALQRLAAETRGHVGEHVARIAEVRQRIGETELELAALDAGRAEDAAMRLAVLRNELAEIDQSLAARQDVLDRTVLRAPAAGIVANLQLPDVGGIVAAGAPILDIVPSEDKLLIDARVSPLDIDVVREGLEAQVHLPAFPGRSLSRMTGTVTTVATNTAHDEVTGQPYYAVRIEVPTTALDEMVTLVPGMPAEILIVAGERTLLAYLTEPILAALRRGLREL